MNAQGSGRRNMKPPRRARKGLTLFELLLALAIFLASLAALAQLLASGARAAAQATLKTEAILRCESQLGEIVSGITRIQAVDGGTFDDDPSWTWRSQVTEGPWPNLKLVEVQVLHAGRSALGNSSYTLRRYLRDPQLFVATSARRTTGSATQAGRQTGRQPTTRPERSGLGSTDSEDSDR
jgi:type II secretion system protein I